MESSGRTVSSSALVVAPKSGPEAARKLGLSVAAVYLAKGRVMDRLKQIIRETLEEPE